MFLQFTTQVQQTISSARCIDVSINPKQVWTHDQPNMEEKMLKSISLVIFCSATLYLILFFFVSAYAGESEQARFSGYILVGGAYSSGDPSLDDASTTKNRRITSLSQSPKKLSEFSLVALGELNYTFASTGTTLSLGSDGGSGLFSISQPFNETGTFSLGLNFMADEVWQDPFIIGTDRAKTDRETKGLILSWDNILNSGFNFSYSVDDIDVENDAAGNRNQNLKRDGKRHTVKGGSCLFATDTQELSTGIIFEQANMDGKSFSYDGYGLELNHIFKGEDWDIETGLSLVYHDYNLPHPEFNKTRKENIFSLESAYTLHDPFGFKNYFITVFGSYARSNSNINFYDDSLLSTGAGVGYSF